MTFDEAFARYGIHPKFWLGMQALILAGAKPTAELQVRIDFVQNYKDCVRDLMSAEAHNNMTPAVVPFQSIEVKDEQPDRFPGPSD